MPAPETTAARLADRVAAILDANGPLAATIEGFEARPGQQQLAQAIARTFTAGGTLVAEAGTGTGKTLAYLVPAILAGKRVLISTGTRTLQDQVFYKDLPALAQALGLDVRAAYMKGRANYLCLHRFEGLAAAADGLPATERRWLGRIQDWAAETTTGDRGEIEDLPDDLPFWGELTATREQCLGRECPKYTDCFITRMRERAAEAQVVIVNHHLLCADASVRQSADAEVIPECPLAIIDEAHQLEDIVTQYFGVAVSTFKLEEFVRDAEGALRALRPDDEDGVRMADVVGEVQYLGRLLFDRARDEARGLSGAFRGANDRVRMTAEAAERIDQDGSGVRAALDRFSALARQVADPPDDLRAMALRADGLRDDLRLLLASTDPEYVHFIEARGRGVFLRAAPIEVANIVRDVVLGTRQATVLTSATLTVGGSFDYVCGRLGLLDAETLRLASEFDYRSQALLYLPPDMPDPRAPEFNRAAIGVVAELLERSRGRAFVLFTSYAALREVAEALERRVEWPLLVQGTAPRTSLLRTFRGTPHAVLLATASFWQGVDVAGDALSCVIIDRLPFASPGDPIVAARVAAIEARGGQPFDEYQVPLATLTLLQGLGRLIRTRTDRGVLSVLDPRLTRKGYGRRFLASLPPAPLTTDLAAVTRFFAAEPIPPP